jgi:RimJ/RimL family protein N-acetyltransferase
METIELVPMRAPEFAVWLDGAIAGYAAELEQAGNQLPGTGRKRAEQQFAEILPDGPQSAGQHLFTILAAPEPGGPPQAVGMIWLGELDRPDMAFIYDFVIQAPYRGRGYGAQALRAIEDQVRALGRTRIGLHVFGHNPRARALYERAGYQITNINMAKQLDP